MLKVSDTYCFVVRNSQNTMVNLAVRELYMGTSGTLNSDEPKIQMEIYQKDMEHASFCQYCQELDHAWIDK